MDPSASPAASFPKDQKHKANRKADFNQRYGEKGEAGRCRIRMAGAKSFTKQWREVFHICSIAKKF